ncbi:hypothetical protein ACFQBQ_07760 [Granulicella cerasi]|uniref:Transposase n=1 Tax=Granulicella cerasi TaxID=741063 RepID=A0ABW1Z8W0_9BACT|nr:hypothetical protein [Granulicella cerasi]
MNAKHEWTLVRELGGRPYLVQPPAHLELILDRMFLRFLQEPRTYDDMERMVQRDTDCPTDYALGVVFWMVRRFGIGRRWLAHLPYSPGHCIRKQISERGLQRLAELEKELGSTC